MRRRRRARPAPRDSAVPRGSGRTRRAWAGVVGRVLRARQQGRGQLAADGRPAGAAVSRRGPAAPGPDASSRRHAREAVEQVRRRLDAVGARAAGDRVERPGVGQQPDRPGADVFVGVVRAAGAVGRRRSGQGRSSVHSARRRCTSVSFGSPKDARARPPPSRSSPRLPMAARSASSCRACRTNHSLRCACRSTSSAIAERTSGPERPTPAGLP